MFFAMALVAACCSCSEAIDTPQDPETRPSTGSVQLEATISGQIDSKTVASDEGEIYSVTWTGTEKVSVNGMESLDIEVDADNARCAVFTFDEVSAPYASVYPAASFRTILGTTGIVFLPSEQKCVAGSFDPEAALMVGYSEQEGKIEFHHAVSYLLVSIKSSDTE